jgi:hypothetical protein
MSYAGTPLMRLARWWQGTGREVVRLRISPHVSAEGSKQGKQEGGTRGMLDVRCGTLGNLTRPWWMSIVVKHNMLIWRAGADIFIWRNSSQWFRACWVTKFLDHTQRRTTVGRTSLGEWSGRRRDLWTTQHSQRTEIHDPGGIRTHYLGRQELSLNIERARIWIGVKRYKMCCCDALAPGTGEVPVQGSCEQGK